KELDVFTGVHSVLDAFVRSARDDYPPHLFVFARLMPPNPASSMTIQSPVSRSPARMLACEFNSHRFDRMHFGGAMVMACLWCLPYPCRSHFPFSAMQLV